MVLLGIGEASVDRKPLFALLAKTLFANAELSRFCARRIESIFAHVLNSAGRQRSTFLKKVEQNVGFALGLYPKCDFLKIWGVFEGAIVSQIGNYKGFGIHFCSVCIPNGLFFVIWGGFEGANVSQIAGFLDLGWFFASDCIPNVSF